MDYAPFGEQGHSTFFRRNRYFFEIGTSVTAIEWALMDHPFKLDAYVHLQVLIYNKLDL